MKKPESIVSEITEYAEFLYDPLRRGQSLMNALFELWPEKYKEITGTIADCFYNDEKIVHFWEAIGRDLE